MFSFSILQTLCLIVSLPISTIFRSNQEKILSQIFLVPEINCHEHIFLPYSEVPPTQIMITFIHRNMKCFPGGMGAVIY